MRFILPSVLIVCSMALAGYFVFVSTYRSLTALEGIFFQILILLFALGGTLWIGRILPANRTHARSAFRRVTSLYSGLARAAAIIEESRGFDTAEDYRIAFARLEELVRNQLITVDDALEDWRDIVPEDTSDVHLRPFPPNPGQE